MIRKLVLLLALALLALPAAALAEDTPAEQAPVAPSANDTCKAQLGQLGLMTFRLTHGTNVNRSNAFGKCVAKLALGVAGVARNAAKECKTERADEGFAAAHDGKSFAEVYGGDANTRNAFGKCVSSKARAQLQETVDTVVSAATSCKAERGQGAAAFRAKYGTGPTKANAFGKCVSKTVQQAAATA
jgi:hypothetical protein